MRTAQEMMELRHRKQFTSDNRSGICPEVWEALADANSRPHAPSYGEDDWTREACQLLCRIFQTDCDVYFVFNGTAANSLALATLCQSYHSVICHESSHIETDECGAPEFFSNGTKLILSAGENGKLLSGNVEQLIAKRSDIHFPRPRVLSLTQATELGTVYTPQEIVALTRCAAQSGLRVHMDGARFANAVASLGCTPADITWKAGVDVLCFGGTKNGMAFGEAVVFFDRSLSTEFAFRCKQAGQLASKMRFISAQWIGLLQDAAWQRHAAQANAMAQRLAAALEQAVPPIKAMFPVQANSVFVQLSQGALAALRALGHDVYTFIGAGGVRLMCSRDTTPSDVDRMVEDVTRSVASTLK